MKSLFLLLLILFPSLIFSQTWQDVGGGTNSSSHGLLVWNEKLVDLGSFNNPCKRVATWDGTQWECLGNGVGLVARAGTVWNGNLVVVGDFWNVFQPCTNCNGIAMWDGTQWTNIGAGFNNDVLCVTVWNGDLVAAGDFTQSNGVPCNRIARWTGAVWEQIGPNNAFNNDIRAMTEFEGELWIGGDFMNVAGCSACDGLVKWSGSAWVGGDSGVDVQGGVDTTVRVLYVNPNDGKMYMGGHFTELNLDGVINTNCKGVAVYDGSNWAPLGTGVNDYVRAIHEYNGSIVVGGYFTDAGGVPANRIAKWNPVTETWSAMGLGFNGVGIDEYVKAAAVYNGTFFAGGAYTIAESGPMNYISQWYETPTAAPIAFINASQTSICAGSCINFTDLSTYSPTSWNWTFPGGSIPSSTNQIPGSVCFATAGTYTVTLQACNSAGCNTTTQNITVTASPTISVNNPTTCVGSTTLLTANPSVFGGTYLWSPGGQTLQSISVSPTVTTPYTVTYTVNGCGSIIGTGTVTIGPAPTVTVNNPTICLGGSTVLTATPSAGGGTYLWSPGGETTSSITVSPTTTTTYSVVYTLNGCTSLAANGTVTIGGGATATVNSTSICSGNSTTLTATPSANGGTYLWSPGGLTTSSITVSPTSTTTYSVVYTLNGCPSTSATGTVTVTTTPSATVNSTSICSGGSATLNATPSAGGGTYLWSPGGQTTSSITVSPTSNTTYSVVYTLNSCPSSSSSGTVSVNQTPTATVNNQTICSGNSTTITATPSVGGGTYLWSPGGQTTASIVVNPTLTATYSVVYTLNNCSSSPATGIVSVNTTPTVTVNSQSICSGSSATLITTPSVGGGTYLWSPGGQTTSSITVSPTSPTTYSVVYTLNSCPSAPALGTVNVTNTPTLTVNNTSICSGNNATLNAVPSTGGGTFIWSPNGETSQAIIVSPSSTTTYSVIYTLNGCSSTAASGTVSVTTSPTVAVNSNSICSGQSATLNAVPSTGGGTFLWSPNGETSQSIIVSPTNNSNYSVIYTLNSCPSNSAMATVSVTTTPTVSVNNTSICDGGTATLTANPSNSGGTYLWSPNGETSSTINVSPTVNSNYTVVYSLNGCSSSLATGNVTITSAPSVTVNSTTICSGQTATLSASPSAIGGTFLWSPSGETSETIVVTPINNQTYSVEYTLNGCPVSTGFGTVAVNQTPTLTVNNASICLGDDAVLTAEPSILGGTFEWSPNGETNQSIVVNPTINASYSVTYELNGCSSGVAVSTVEVLPMPDLTLNVLSASISAVQSNVDYQWLDCNDNMNAISGEINQVFTPTMDGTYAVEITLDGCTGISECQIFETGGLNENNPTLISVYPNPFNDVLNIKVSDQLVGTTLSLVNSIGQWIQDIPITKIEFDLYMNSLETGLYYLTSSKISTVHQKLVKF